MGKFIIGLIIGILLVPVGFYFYCVSGHAPVATSAAPMPLERFFAKTALHATLRRDAPKTHSTKATEGELMAGAHVYAHHCAVCHGLPDKPPTDVAKGMFPRPPQLLKPGEMVTDDPAGVTFWKAKNGIRLTGMPGFGGSLSESQMWNVSLMLANADKLPPDVRTFLESPGQMPPPSTSQSSAAKKSSHVRK